MNRRNFIAGAGVLFLGCTCGGLRLRAQGAQETGRTEGAGRDIIDFHAHCMIPAVADLVKGTPFARTIPKFQILTDDRLRAMDEREIATQALSINQYWWYAADRDLATKIVRLHDESLAALCAKRPSRFVALTSPALQFPELAAEQLRTAVRDLGFKGASIGGHVQGEVPVDPKFDPFWQAAQDLDVPIFIHPNNAENITREGAWNGGGDLGNIIGNPLETTLFLSRMIFEGVLDRFPRLKFVAAHGGGSLASYLGRTAVACKVRENAGCKNKKDPQAYFRDQIWVDSLVFSPEGVRHLVAEIGAGQIVYGSDMPFSWPDTTNDILSAPGLTAPDKTAIFRGNAARLLKL